MNKALFIDRDGVLVKLIDRGDRGKTPPWKNNELEFLPNIRESILDAREAGYKILVVSNQPDFKSGDMDIRFLWYVSSVLRTTFNVDYVESALVRGAWEYKPNPGMVLSLARQFDIDLSKSWMIGDTWKDCVCAQIAKVSYIHIGNEDPIGDCFYRVNSLSTAIEVIINRDKRIINNA